MAQFIQRLQAWWLSWREPSEIKQMRQDHDFDGLIGLLKHPKMKVRWAAIRTLGELWNIEALVKLGSRNFYERLDAIEELKDSSDSRVLPPLLALLEDPSVDWDEDWYFFYPIRTNAIKALCQIGHLSTLDPLLDIRSTESWGIDQPDSYIETLICKYVVNLGQDAFNYALVLLKNPDPIKRSRAMEIFIILDDPQAIEVLNQVLIEEEVSWLRQGAIGVMDIIDKEHKDERVLLALIEGLADAEDDPIREWYVGRLRDFPDERIIPSIVEALQNTDWLMWMIQNIIDFGTSEAKAAVSSYVENKGGREQTLQIVEALLEQRSSPEEMKDLGMELKVLQYVTFLCQHGEARIIPTLVEVLQAVKTERKESTLEEIAQMDTPVAKAVLEALARA